MDKNYQYTIRSLLFTSNLTKKLIDFKILFLFVNHAIGRYIKEQHPSSFCLDKIKFTNHRNVVWTQQQKKAQQVLELLLNTDLSLREISDQTGLSYGNVRRMYRGDSWKMLYERSPQSIRPRRKNKHN